MPLPTINLPSAVSIPAVPAVPAVAAIPAQTVSAAFVPSLNIQADIDPSKPWPMVATLNGLAADGTGYATDLNGDVISQQVSRDLKVDMGVYPLVAETLGQVLEVISALSTISHLEPQITTQLAAINTFNDQITTTNARITVTQALIDQDTANSVDPTADQATLSAQQATLASQQTTQAALINSVWVTLLGQWRAIAVTLGVTDPHALPPAMVGLTVPSGITI